MGLNFKESEDETVDQKCGHAVGHVLAIEYRCLAQVVVFRPHAIKITFFVISNSLYLDNGPMDTNTAFLFSAIMKETIIGSQYIYMRIESVLHWWWTKR